MGLSKQEKIQGNQETKVKKRDKKVKFKEMTPRQATCFKEVAGWKEVNQINPAWNMLFIFFYQNMDWRGFSNLKRICRKIIRMINS